MPNSVVQRIENAEYLSISAISCREPSQLVKRQRVILPMVLNDWVNLAVQGIQVLPINQAIALLSDELPEHYKDPADRFIIATSIYHQMPIINLDTVFPAYQEIKHLLINK